jgi:hypothetical protein
LQVDSKGGIREDIGNHAFELNGVLLHSSSLTGTRNGEARQDFSPASLPRSWFHFKPT